MRLNLNNILVIGGFALLAIGIGAFLYFRPKTIVEQFQRPLATNAYIPDPDINSPSYQQQRVRQEYEKYTKLETHPYNDFGDIWNVSNIHPTYETYLQKKYF